MAAKSRVFTVMAHEIKMALKDPLFFIPYVLIPAITMAGFWMYVKNGPIPAEEIYASYKIMMLIIGTLASTLSLVLCADSFAGEKERNSLEILLCTPLGLGELFLGKLLGILPLPIIIGWLTQLILTLLCYPFLPEQMDVNSLFIAFCTTPLSAVFLCSLSLFFSLRTQTARSAAQFSGLMAIIYLIILQGAGFWLYSSKAFLCWWCIVLLTLSLLAYGFSWRKFEKVLY